MALCSSELNFNGTVQEFNKSLFGKSQSTIPISKLN